MSNYVNDELSAEAIRRRLSPGYSGIGIIVEQLTESTNDVAKRLAALGGAHGTLVAAEGQAAGRGRFSRGFYSPVGSGLYMSVILRPGAMDVETPLLTVVAALSVCRAIGELTPLSPKIKWVNDVLVDGKKVCGILTEAVADPENGAASAVVIGIGVNVRTAAGDFPEDIRERVASLYPDGEAGASRNEFAAAIMNNLFALYEGHAGADRQYLHEYRALSCVIGRDVEYARGGERGSGTATGIDEYGRLTVMRDGDRETITLNSGEVSIKTKGNGSAYGNI